MRPRAPIVSDWRPRRDAGWAGRAGREVRRLPVWMDGTRLQPGEERALAVELERPAQGTDPHRVELRERDGERGVSLFPFEP